MLRLRLDGPDRNVDLRLEDITRRIARSGAVQLVIHTVSSAACSAAPACSQSRGVSLDVSSTALRERVADGHPIRYLVPRGVEELITERGLYRG